MLELKNITKYYGDFAAVNDMSLKVNDGEVFGLLGPNGAGKSTTVSMISSIISLTKGEILIDGKNITKNADKIKNIMSIVPQDIALYESLTARDNLEFFGSLYGLKGKELNQRVDEVLDIIELKDKEKLDVGTFSGGMKRRVNIGVALMNKPKLLILDEPTVGIDPQSRNHILETVKKLNENEGMTVIYTSHYMEEVEFLCNRVAIVDHGKLIALGTKEELKKKVNASDVLKIKCNNLDDNSISQIKKIEGINKITQDQNQLVMLISTKNRNVLDIVDDIRKLGVKVTGFNYEEVNLESIFLEITGKSLRE